MEQTTIRELEELLWDYGQNAQEKLTFVDKNEIHVEIPEKLPDTIDQDSMWKWFRKRKLSGENAFRVSKVRGLTASRVRVSGGCCNVDVMQQVIDIARKYGNCNGKLQEQEGPAIAERLLEKLGFEKDISERVQYLSAHHHTYNNINEIDYQILVEADFLVNIMEDGLSKEAALKACHNIFKTTCGKTICRKMFDI